MIQKLLALFGYVKVPREAVQLSTEQEYFLEGMHRLFETIRPEHAEIIRQYADGQKTLTKFLRSGRM